MTSILQRWTCLFILAILTLGFAPPGAQAGGGKGKGLKSLLGTWEFTYTIISTFTDNYDLQRITTSEGIRVIVGIDLVDRSPIVAARTRDLTSQPPPFDFALLDPDSLSCDFYLFNKTGSSTIAGVHVLVLKSAGTCKTIVGSPHPMTGTRTSASTTTREQSVAAVEEEDLKLEEVTGIETTEDLILPGVGDEMVRELAEMLQ